MFSFPLSISRIACFTSLVVEIWLNIVLVQLIAWVITCPFCKSLGFRMLLITKLSGILSLKHTQMGSWRAQKVPQRVPGSHRCPCSLPPAAPENKTSVFSGPLSFAPFLLRRLPGLLKMTYFLLQNISLSKTISRGSFGQTWKVKFPLSLFSERWYLPGTPIPEKAHGQSGKGHFQGHTGPPWQDMGNSFLFLFLSPSHAILVHFKNGISKKYNYKHHLIFCVQGPPKHLRMTSVIWSKTLIISPIIKINQGMYRLSEKTYLFNKCLICPHCFHCCLYVYSTKFHRLHIQALYTKSSRKTTKQEHK